jgi:hypothetical protein
MNKPYMLIKILLALLSKTNETSSSCTGDGGRKGEKAELLLVGQLYPTPVTTDSWKRMKEIALLSGQASRSNLFTFDDDTAIL